MQQLTQRFLPKHKFGDKIWTDGAGRMVSAHLPMKPAERRLLPLWIDCSLSDGTRCFPHAGSTLVPMWKNARLARRIGLKIPRLDSAGKSGQD